MEDIKRLSRKERVAAWSDILSSGKLLELHTEVKNKLLEDLTQNPGRILKEFEEYKNNREIKTITVDEEARFDHPGLTTTESHTLFSLFTPKTASFCQLRCMADSHELREPHLSLFLSCCFLYDQTIRATIAAGPEVGRIPERDKQLFRDATDLGSGNRIVLDNVQTFFDTFRFVTKDCESRNQQISVMKRLLHERSSYGQEGAGGRVIDLNPGRDTNIELMARAPFGFWGGTVRNSMPVAIDGKPVLNVEELDKPLFSPEFVYLVTREHVRVHDPKYETVENLMRHGGCPVLHHQFKKENILEEFGDVFVKYYEATSQNK